jgi:hypothetical protein
VIQNASVPELESIGRLCLNANLSQLTRAGSLPKGQDEQGRNWGFET